jgi:hypothetical protein
MTREDPHFSIIVGIHNGVPLAVDCLDSILASDYSNYEIICIDSGSTDGTAKLLQERFGGRENIRVISTSNVGNARAYNMGASLARYDLLLFINFDTLVDRAWLRTISAALEASSDISIAQAMILDMRAKEDTIQCAGIYMLDYCGWTWSYMKGEKYDNFMARTSRDSVEIGIASGTAMVMRKYVYRRLGGFDDTFFMYFEEPDICWRAQLAGMKVALIPGAKVYHMGGDVRKYTVAYGLSKSLKSFHSHKNNLRMMIKNYSMKKLVEFTPTMVVVPLLLRLYGLYKEGDYYSLRSMFSAYLWTLRNMRQIWSARARVQNEVRIEPDERAIPKISKRLPLSSILGIMEAKRGTLRKTRYYSRLGRSY